MKTLVLMKILVFAFVFNSASSQIVFPTSPPGPQSCTTSTGLAGKCYEGIRRCPGNVRTRRPSFCGFSSGRLSICCPTVSEPIKVNNTVQAPVTNFKCGERGRIPITLGSFLSRRKRSEPIEPKALKSLKLDILKDPGNQVAVVGGIESYRNSWPWMVLLGRPKGDSNHFFCSGILINQEYVITAAHCALDLAPFFARLGEHDNKAPSISAPPEDIPVGDVIFHPKFEYGMGYHDIALLKLSRLVQLRSEVKPVCLPWDNLAKEDLIKEKVTVTGWGHEEFGGRPSRVLREVVVEVFDPAVCNRSYSTLPDFTRTFPRGMTKDDIVCAGDLAGGKDSCQGDSGGPMVHEELNGVYSLAGIISKGFGCGLKDFPGIYAPIRNFDTLTWIKKVAF